MFPLPNVGGADASILFVPIKPAVYHAHLVVRGAFPPTSTPVAIAIAIAIAIHRKVANF